jgi:hypothetical protein
MPTFTPAQQTLYDALMKADRSNVVIMQNVLQAWKANVRPDPDPKDYGAPVGTPAWTVIEDAANAFDKAVGARDDDAAVAAVPPVVHAVLATKR